MTVPPTRYCRSSSFHRFQNTTASTMAAKLNRMANSQKVGSTFTLLFITTKELPQMMVARTIRGLANLARTLFSVFSLILYRSFRCDKIVEHCRAGGMTHGAIAAGLL